MRAQQPPAPPRPSSSSPTTPAATRGFRPPSRLGEGRRCRPRRELPQGGASAPDPTERTFCSSSCRTWTKRSRLLWNVRVPFWSICLRNRASLTSPRNISNQLRIAECNGLEFRLRTNTGTLPAMARLLGFHLVHFWTGKESKNFEQNEANKVPHRSTRESTSTFREEGAEEDEDAFSVDKALSLGTGYWCSAGHHGPEESCATFASIFGEFCVKMGRPRPNMQIVLSARDGSDQRRRYLTWTQTKAQNEYAHLGPRGIGPYTL